jgi:hypothetical protein
VRNVRPEHDGTCYLEAGRCQSGAIIGIYIPSEDKYGGGKPDRGVQEHGRDYIRIVHENRKHKKTLAQVNAHDSGDEV